jgi:hypothetical protein
MLYSTFGFPVPLVNNLAFIIALIAEAFGAGGVAGETSWNACLLAPRPHRTLNGGQNKTST